MHKINVNNLQVCIPGLHLSLGIFNRLYNLLEDSCQQLDLELAARNSQISLGGPSFQQYAAALAQLTQLKEKHHGEEQEAQLLTQLATYLTITVPEPDTSPTVQRVRAQASLAQKQAATTVKIIVIEMALQSLTINIMHSISGG